jgi:hypothetical protein
MPRESTRKRISCHGDGDEDVVLIAPESCLEELRSLINRIDVASQVEIPEWITEILEAYEFDTYSDLGIHLR